jgi:glycosyltransferase involved in cell wall biosynthesis
MSLRIGILHYTAPPVIGGVEAVMAAHARTMVQAGSAVTFMVGRGAGEALPEGVRVEIIPEIDSLHPPVVALNEALEQGRVPADFEALVDVLVEKLAPVLAPLDALIVHNVFTKHFNLPLTAALYRLLDQGRVGRCLAWCHDFTWTSTNSRHKVHPGYPWDLLRTRRADVTYVVVSEQRQRTLAGLYDCPPEEIHVVYNGVDPDTLLGLTAEGRALIERLGLLEADLTLLMPVRVTQAKNVEYALRVLAALKAQGGRPKLVLTGPPDPHDEQSMAYFHSLQTQRDELGLADEMRFVFEAGPHPQEPFTIDYPVVGDLFRVCDVMLMPSHREGFGMPVLEAGLVGMPVVCTDVPAAREIGGDDVILFDAGDPPEKVARRILDWAAGSRVHQLRRRVRQRYTWRAIFERDIRPLLEGEAG